jgi:HEAT repeat protein
LRQIARRQSRGATALPLLRKALRDPDPKVRSRAASTWHWSGQAKATAPALIAALKDPDRDVCDAAAWALGAVGPEAEPAILDLVKMLREERDRHRRAAFSALQSIGAPAVPVLPSRRCAPATEVARLFAS